MSGGEFVTRPDRQCGEREKQSFLKGSKKTFVHKSFPNSPFFLVLFLFGIFLSVTGEKRALTFSDLPRLPNNSVLSTRVLSAQLIGALFFSGFRGMIVDLVWMRIDTLWYTCRYYKLPPLYEFVTSVQPEYIDGWVMGGWHMAYNMSLSVPKSPNLSPQLCRKVEEKWVYQGLDFLKAGAMMNPESHKIYFEIAWTYYHRLKDYKNSIPWFEKSAEQKGAPYYVVRLIAFAYEKMGDRESAYKKWVALHSHPSYEDPSVKKIIDDHTERLKKL